MVNGAREAFPNQPTALTGITILALVFTGAVAATGISPILPQILAEYGHSAANDFLVKTLVSVFGIGALIGSPLTPFLLKRWGLRDVLLGVVIVFIAAAPASIYAPNLLTLIFIRFVLAVGAAIGTTAYHTFILTQFPHGKREHWLGYVATIGAFWAVVATSLAGQLGNFGWRYALLINLLALPMLALVMLSFPAADDHFAEPRNSVTVDQADAIKALWPEVIAGFLAGTVALSVYIYLPFHLVEHGLHDPAKIGRLFAAYSAFSAGSSFLYGTARRYFSFAAINIVGFALAGTGYAMLVSISGSAPLLLLNLVLLGGGVGLITPNIMAFAGRHPPEKKARAIGITKAGYFAGPFIFQSLVGLLGFRHSDMTLLLLAALCLPAMFFMWPFGRLGSTSDMAKDHP